METIGPYEVVRELGRGGMGMVYEVLEPGTSRHLALKLILTSQVGSQDALTRFGREAQAMGKVQHTHLIRVHGLGKAPQGPYIVTELVQGENLEALARGNPMDPREAAEIVHKLAGAVAALNEAGILHRDIKPENVILRPKEAGGPVLLDLGLARDESAERLTQTGMMLGTPSYMSPEQADGSVRSMGPHTDVYGLGGVLLMLITGQPPFTGTSAMRVIKAVLTKDPEWPSQSGTHVPLHLEAICRKALAKLPLGRYRTARALQADLKLYLDGKAPEAWKDHRPPRNKTGIVIAAATISLLAVVGIAVLFAKNLQKTRNDARQAQNSKGPSETGTPEERQAERDLKQAEREFARLSKYVEHDQHDNAVAWLEEHGERAPALADRVRREYLHLGAKLAYQTPQKTSLSGSAWAAASFALDPEILVRSIQSADVRHVLHWPRERAKAPLLPPLITTEIQTERPAEWNCLVGQRSAAGWAAIGASMAARATDGGRANLVLVRPAAQPPDKPVLRRLFGEPREPDGELGVLSLAATKTLLAVGLVNGTVYAMTWTDAIESPLSAKALAPPKDQIDTSVVGVALTSDGLLAVIRSQAETESNGAMAKISRSWLSLYACEEGAWSLLGAEEISGRGTGRPVHVLARPRTHEFFITHDWTYRIRVYDADARIFLDDRQFQGAGARSDIMAKTDFAHGADLAAHSQRIRDLCVSPNGDRLFTVSGKGQAGTLRVWDASSGYELACRGGDDSEQYLSVDIDDEGKHLLVAVRTMIDVSLQVFDVDAPDPPKD